MRSKRNFEAPDIVLCLVLAARIHRKPEAVRRTAKRLLQVIPKEDRASVGRYVTALAPLETVEQLLHYWFDQHNPPS